MGQASLVITPGSPDEDPRSLAWAASLSSLDGRPTFIAYGRKPFSKRSIALPNSVGTQTNLIPVPLLKFPKSQALKALVKRAKSNHFKFINRFIEQIDTNGTVMHRTLLSHCLQQFWIGEVSRQSTHALNKIVGTDIQGLFSAAANYSGYHPIIYDAQEVTTIAFPGLSEIEEKFWVSFERELLALADLAVTVSPGIARWQEEKFQVKHYVLPNFETSSDTPSYSGEATLPVKFVYYGGCAGEKNVGSLLRAWDLPRETATLTIVSPKSLGRVELEILWQKIRRPHCGVVFTSHDSATTASKFLSEFDVGIVPYAYPFPYSEASPNKFGQYVAAGLCVASNFKGFVTSVVQKNELGVEIDLTKATEVHKQLSELTDLETVNRYKKCARDAHKRHLNWENHFDEIAHVIVSIQRDESATSVFEKIENRFCTSVGDWTANLLKAMFDLCARRLIGTRVGSRLRRLILHVSLTKQ